MEIDRRAKVAGELKELGIITPSNLVSVMRNHAVNFLPWTASYSYPFSSLLHAIHLQQTPKVKVFRCSTQ